MFFPKRETECSQTIKMYPVSEWAAKEVFFERPNKSCFIEWNMDPFYTVLCLEEHRLEEQTWFYIFIRSRNHFIRGEGAD